MIFDGCLRLFYYILRKSKSYLAFYKLSVRRVEFDNFNSEEENSVQRDLLFLSVDPLRFSTNPSDPSHFPILEMSIP